MQTHKAFSAQKRSLFAPPHVLCLAVLCALAPISAHTEEAQRTTRDLHADFFVNSALRSGVYNELVFSNVNGESKKLSQLDWEARPLLYCGGGASIYWKLLETHIYGAGFFPFEKSIGIMQDSDWEDYTVKNKYSESDNFFGRGFLFSARAGARIPFRSFSIFPYCAAEWEFMSFYAQGITKQYSEAGTSYTEAPKVTVAKYDGKDVISYRRETFFTWLGMEAAYTHKERARISAGFSAAPWCRIDSIDNHLLRSVHFYDSMEEIFCAWRVNAHIKHRITKCLWLDGGAAFTWLNELRGNTASNSSGEDDAYSRSRSESGASAHYADFSLSVLFRPF